MTTPFNSYSVLMRPHSGYIKEEALWEINVYRLNDPETDYSQVVGSCLLAPEDRKAMGLEKSDGVVRMSAEKWLELWGDKVPSEVLRILQEKVPDFPKRVL